MLQVRHDKHVHTMNFNKRKISCHSLKFSVESTICCCLQNFKIHTYVILMAVVDEKTWFGDNPMTLSNFQTFLVN